MSWSYDPSNLDTSTASGRLNTVRLLVGDTEVTDPQVQNEEVLFALSESGNNIYSAAAWAARAISSKYSRQVTSSLDGALSANYSDLAKQYKTLADDLEYQGKTSGAIIGVVAGGITKTQVENVRANTNRIEGSFRRDRFKNPPSYQTPEYE
jgi:orotate phosphoribosyltransferase-like protein